MLHGFVDNWGDDSFLQLSAINSFVTLLYSNWTNSLFLEFVISILMFKPFKILPGIGFVQIIKASFRQGSTSKPIGGST